ncbi:hypothetical protein [Halovibrio variabilis]|uniref:hypothetical protein n=1 Tax=Halovibrio variabilis TaxID=31910 RepID=UPI0011BF87CA|nr:hypothetical protein [Halovibrio variabilis]
MTQSSFMKRLSYAMNSPWAMWVRMVVSVLVALLALVVSSRRVESDSFLLPLWQRSYENGFWDAFWGFGGDGNIAWVTPSAVVGVIAAISVVFMAFRGLFYYPQNLNTLFIFFLLSDFILISALVTSLVYGGGAIESFYYLGAFIAGVVFFGMRTFSRIAMLAFIALVVVRLLFVESTFVYLYLAPVCGLLYFFLRAPFESADFKIAFDELGRHFAFQERHETK